MSVSVMVLLRMVMGNMTIIYQKKKRDASKKCMEMKNIIHDSFSVRNLAGGTASDVIPWVEIENHGLKMPLKSRLQRF